MRHRLFIPAATALLFALAACTQDEGADDNRLPEGEYPVVICHRTVRNAAGSPFHLAADGDWQGVTSVALKMADAGKGIHRYTSTDFKECHAFTRERPVLLDRRDPNRGKAWWPFDNADITQMPAVKVAEDQSKLGTSRTATSSLLRTGRWNLTTRLLNLPTARHA